MTKQLLFVSGVPRSGTSAMVKLLNGQDGFMIGKERYAWIHRADGVTPEHFRKERFLDIRDGDTHNPERLRGDGEANTGAGFDAARVIGDKFTLLYLDFPRMFERFPQAKHVFMIRNPLSVAESYQSRRENPEDNWQKDYKAGVRIWNRSLRAISRLTPEQRQSIFFAEYEKIYFDIEEIQRLFDFLEMPLNRTRTGAILKQAEELNHSMVRRRDDIRLYVARHADWQSYRELARIIHE